MLIYINNIAILYFSYNQYTGLIKKLFMLKRIITLSFVCLSTYPTMWTDFTTAHKKVIKKMQYDYEKLSNHMTAGRHCAPVTIKDISIIGKLMEALYLAKQVDVPYESSTISHHPLLQHITPENISPEIVTLAHTVSYADAKKAHKVNKKSYNYSTQYI